MFLLSYFKTISANNGIINKSNGNETRYEIILYPKNKINKDVPIK